MRTKLVNINVKKVENGYVLACDFDRYSSEREIITVSQSRTELDDRITSILDDLDTEEDE